MSDKLFEADGARRFFAEFWGRKPRLERGALTIEPDIGREQLIELACRDDVESRLVLGAGQSWEVRHGPFRRGDFKRLPRRNWTLLVQGVENFVAAARALQMQFALVPYALHDDVMVSYAAPGGSVGPHYDSYDVFLLQSAGMRRWQISRQQDLALLADAPLKILRRFRPQREWTLRRGDLLYLPPRYAHHGVALCECTTWSIGVRVPKREELASRFLDFVQDHLRVGNQSGGRLRKPEPHPASIDAALRREMRAAVSGLRWNNTDIARCLGEYLSEPRPNIRFERKRFMQRARFARWVAGHGLRLDLKSRMLVSGRTVFINGESMIVEAAARKTLQQLADTRCLPPGVALDAKTRVLLYRWYSAGYIETGEKQNP